ncbi:DUF732 domain-containing protein [Gordonia amarae]|uniref:DUF732 domain-containing protein n=2 Tax=Gordonia amarae TaxID=36821 RepID=G7GR28_9ACTN|nr:DUF732 domain-containing protein [Gordonia amarae]MCS3877527.1 hypothetical protein [Gordonia amarae]QHN16257.1 DUF732 domain-containing protein [Gordonia amarae]QHN20826.1 DUF732 domain-containing protein [Gordonia amarae]QHN29677.1 DUF732 domain-containing protein [Gordonia amarae]QHN38453.1 DUF732 domain-containing protein [Gordonia amarae]
MTRRSIRWSLLPTVFGAVLVFGGCTTDGTPVAGDDTRATTSTTDTATPDSSTPDTTTTETSAPQTSSPDTSGGDSPGSSGRGLSVEKENEVFLRTLKQLNVAVPDEARYIAVGRQACTDIRGGKSFIDVALNNSLGLGPVSAGSLIGAAIGVFCPDQQSKISAGG